MYEFVDVRRKLDILKKLEETASIIRDRLLYNSTEVSISEFSSKVFQLNLGSIKMNSSIDYDNQVIRDVALSVKKFLNNNLKLGLKVAIYQNEQERLILLFDDIYYELSVDHYGNGKIFYDILLRSPKLESELESRVVDDKIKFRIQISRIQTNSLQPTPFDTDFIYNQDWFININDLVFFINIFRKDEK